MRFLFPSYVCLLPAWHQSLIRNCSKALTYVQIFTRYNDITHLASQKNISLFILIHSYFLQQSKVVTSFVKVYLYLDFTYSRYSTIVCLDGGPLKLSIGPKRLPSINLRTGYEINLYYFDTSLEYYSSPITICHRITHSVATYI